MRYELLRRTETELEVMIIEEQNYAPAGWRIVRYSTGSGLVTPEVDEPCLRAQVVAFCRTYLSRFSS